MKGVAIIGAGPAGAAAAIALRNSGAESVLVLDSGAEADFRYGESANPGVRLLLEAMGLSTELDVLGHLVCRGSCSLWGSDSLEYKDFHTLGHGYGWHLDRTAFDRWLREQATALGAQLRTGIKLSTLLRERNEANEEHWRLQLDNGESIDAQFVIDASGRSAFVASSLGAKSHKLDRLVAVALTLDGCSSELIANRSLVESESDGWWYAAAIPQGRTVVMFMTDADLIRNLGVSTRAGFSARLKQTREICKHVRADEQGPAPEIVGALSRRTEPVTGEGWMAIGDAAIGLDPLTSSGISSALEDGMFAAQAIMAQRAGDNMQMEAYAQRIGQAWQIYLQQRNELYSRETRWQSDAFWQRRQGALKD